MKKNKKSTGNYHDDLISRLKDLRYAEGYLNAVLEDGDKKTFFLALRDVVEAQGGMTRFAKLTRISREHIYRMLSEKGNPEFATLQALLSAFDLQFSVTAKPQNKKAA